MTTTTVRTVEDVCELAREELAKLETAAKRVRAARGENCSSAQAEVRTSRAAVQRLVAEAAALALRRRSAPRRTGIPDPVPDVDQDPED